jgi:very-short-patch-repair endonuclease
VLACGGVGAAVLSHRSAGAIWELTRSSGGRLEVTTLRGSRSTRTIRVHQSATLEPAIDVSPQPDGLPVTSVARTLLDLASVLTAHQIERACHRAQFLRLLDAAAIDGVLSRSGRGCPRGLRTALATLAIRDPDITRSDLEELMLALVARHGLSRPIVNTAVLGYEIDFFWPDHKLVVETDGAAAHLTAVAFENDRRRDAALQVAGYRAVRFSRRQLIHEPETVADALRRLLAAGSSP